MGVEPTSACAAQPLTGFEDRGIHRDTSTPSPRHYTERQPYFNIAISVIMWANAKPDKGANDARLPLGARHGDRH